MFLRTGNQWFAKLEAGPKHASNETSQSSNSVYSLEPSDFSTQVSPIDPRRPNNFEKAISDRTKSKGQKMACKMPQEIQGARRIAKDAVGSKKLKISSATQQKTSKIIEHGATCSTWPQFQNTWWSCRTCQGKFKKFEIGDSVSGSEARANQMNGISAKQSSAHPYLFNVWRQLWWRRGVEVDGNRREQRQTVPVLLERDALASSSSNRCSPKKASPWLGALRLANCFRQMTSFWSGFFSCCELSSTAWLM